MQEKPVLDPCCGARKFYFAKDSPVVLFGDIRDETFVQVDGRRLTIHPDMKMDFTNLPFEDESFALVVFDPPHLKRAGQNSFMAQSYGVLPSKPVEYVVRGFKECWRVLKRDGTLIFKWNDTQIPLNSLLNAFGVRPLFGNRRATGKTGSTYWLCFFKDRREVHEKRGERPTMQYALL